MFETVDLFILMSTCFAVFIGLFGIGAYLLLRRSLYKTVGLISQAHQENIKMFAQRLTDLQEQKEHLEFQVKTLTLSQRKLTSELHRLYLHLNEELPEDISLKPNEIIH